MSHNMWQYHVSMSVCGIAASINYLLYTNTLYYSIDNRSEYSYNYTPNPVIYDLFI